MSPSGEPNSYYCNRIRSCENLIHWFGPGDQPQASVAVLTNDLALGNTQVQNVEQNRIVIRFNKGHFSDQPQLASKLASWFLVLVWLNFSRFSLYNQIPCGNCRGPLLVRASIVYRDWWGMVIYLSLYRGRPPSKFPFSIFRTDNIWITLPRTHWRVVDKGVIWSSYSQVYFYTLRGYSEKFQAPSHEKCTGPLQ